MYFESDFTLLILLDRELKKEAAPKILNLFKAGLSQSLALKSHGALIESKA